MEPYAGGAGAALGLLVTGQVQRVAINDLDPAIYAFWRSVVREPEKFTMMLESVELTIEEWHRQKAIYESASTDDFLLLGFAAFYLNRTNHSGVLNGGPIGGQDQSGNYKIDARFNRSNLKERIRLIELYADKISVSNEDGIEIIESYADDRNALIYADPPYFSKAGTLYLNAFEAEDHSRLADCLNDLSNTFWLLTYDNAPEVPQLYEARRRETFSLRYSAHRVTEATEIMVFSDSLTIA